MTSWNPTINHCFNHITSIVKIPLVYAGVILLLTNTMGEIPSKFPISFGFSHWLQGLRSLWLRSKKSDPSLTKVSSPCSATRLNSSMACDRPRAGGWVSMALGFSPKIWDVMGIRIPKIFRAWWFSLGKSNVDYLCIEIWGWMWMYIYIYIF